MPGLDTPVMYVRGVGPKVAELLAAKGILTAEDLLYHLPFRYEDRQNPRSLDELKPCTSTKSTDPCGFSKVCGPILNFVQVGDL